MEPFKNVFSPALVRCIAGHLQKHADGFSRRAFESSVLATLETLELKDRAQLIADHVHRALPADAAARNRILLKLLHPSRQECQSDKAGLSGWAVMPLGLVVGQHGLADFDRSLNLLKTMTPLFSSEFAVRYFLLANLPRALEIMQSWAHDSDPHVRRLVSEGTRPRLPWAMRLPSLIDDPSPMMHVLKTLRDDDSEYVRRSVANHLNDIAKDHPDAVADVAKEWMKGASANRQRLIRHACRTLVKQGHEGTMDALGYAPPEIGLRALRITTPTVRLGEALSFDVDIRSTSERTQPLIVDYVIHLRKANGTLSPKVFKWKNIALEGKDVLKSSRRHALRPITTRVYHAGTHALSLRINGRDYGHAQFDLVI